ncbi:hypothetical protein Tco_0860577 [Tanacetum coccineum]|uniref:Uncharacterized protein n=1 Tax=Tanacetum coccineum TaxID=301880 RepID=A0ABQ5BFA7_9ASTR
MHTSRDDYLINTLRFVSAKEASQIYGAILPESLTSPKMKETKAYKTYLEPTGKLKRVTRPAKKSTKALTGGFVIRETPKMSLSKKKEKVDVAKGKGVELLSEVALTEDAYGEENDIDDENTQSDNENGSDSEHETDENEAGSEYDHQENEEQVEDDEEENNDEFVKTPSNDSDSKDETKITDKPEDDEDEEMDYTTSTNVEMINVQQGNENLEISQVVRDAHVTLSIVPQKTEVPVTSSSHSSDLAAKFLNFANIPTTEAKIVSPMDVPVYHEVPSGQTPTLLTVHVSVITKSLREVSNIAPPVIQSMVTESLEHAVLAKESSQPQSSYEAAALLIKFELKKILIDKMDKSESYLAALEHIQFYDGLIKYYDLEKSLFSTYDKVYSLKRSKKDKDNDKDPSVGSYRGLKKRKTSKDAEPTKGPNAKESKSGSSKGTKSQPKSFGKSIQSEEPEFEVTYLDMPQDQEGNLGNDDEPIKETVSKRYWFTKPTQSQEPTDPDWNVGNTPQQGQTQN